MVAIFVDGETAYELYQSGQGTNDVQALADGMRQSTQQYQQLAQRLGKVTELMRQAVTGDSGDAAAESTKPLMLGVSDSAQMVDQTNSATQNQSQMWHDASNSVHKPPPAPSQPNGFDLAIKSVTDPDGAAAEAASYEQAMEERQRVLQHNVDTFNAYSSGTAAAQGRVTTSYPEVRDVGGEIAIATKKDGGPAVQTSAPPNIGTAAASAPSSAPHAAGGGGPSSQVPSVGQPSVYQTPPPTSGTGPGTTAPGAPPSGGPGGNPPPVRPGTPPIGALPIGAQPPADREAAARRTPVRGPGSRAAERFAGQRMAGKGSPLAAGQKAGGSAPITGGKPATGMGPGKGAGVGAPGSGPGGGTAAQTAKAGLGGRGAGGGMMGGGAGAGRGQNDDKEHKNKYAVDEELDAGLQVEVDEYGERIVDEETGHTVVSQVIGQAEYEQQDSPGEK